MSSRISALIIIVNLFALPLSTGANAAILHFYSNPRVQQSLYHTTLELDGFIYEADAGVGSRRVDVESYDKNSGAQVEISDSLVDRFVLENLLGQEFDYNFIWDDNTLYCSEYLAKALHLEPTPMSFKGTHYVKYYPQWELRNDPGFSPDQLWVYALKNGTILKNEIPGLPNQATDDPNPRFTKEK